MRNIKLKNLAPIEDLSIAVAEIDELDLTEFDFTVNTLGGVVSKFPHLRSLDLSDTTINEEDLLTLEGNSTLETLDISGTRVINLSVISSLVKLRHLTAYDTGINDLSPLENLPLIVLEIGRAKVTDLTPLGAVETLEVINLQGNTGVMSLSVLSNLKHLTRLDVKGTSVDANELAKLEQLPKLIRLDVNVDIEFAAKAVLKNIARNYQQRDLAPTLFHSATSSSTVAKSGLVKHYTLETQHTAKVYPPH